MKKNNKSGFFGPAFRVQEQPFRFLLLGGSCSWNVRLCVSNVCQFVDLDFHTTYFRPARYRANDVACFKLHDILMIFLNNYRTGTQRTAHSRRPWHLTFWPRIKRMTRTCVLSACQVLVMIRFVSVCWQPDIHSTHTHTHIYIYIYVQSR